MRGGFPMPKTFEYEFKNGIVFYGRDLELDIV
jgi:hypothetical protein